MRRADQAGFVGIVRDQFEIDGDVIALEECAGAPDCKLADAAAAKAAAEDDRLGIGPRLVLEEALEHRVERLGIVLDGA